jgi:hypothetical protein
MRDMLRGVIKNKDRTETEGYDTFFVCGKAINQTKPIN